MNKKKEISIKDQKPVTKLKAIEHEDKRRSKKRIAGYGAKKYPKFKLPDNFNAPLPDEILIYFTSKQK